MQGNNTSGLLQLYKQPASTKPQIVGKYRYNLLKSADSKALSFGVPIIIGMGEVPKQ